MKREELLEKGLTEEQITFVLNSIHSNAKTKDDEIAKLQKELTSKNEIETKYNQVQSQLDEINKANMTEQEKLVEREKAIAEKEKATAIIYNTAKAKEILAQTGLSGEELENLVKTAIGSNEEETISKSNVILNTLNSIKENTKKSTTEELINMNAKPNGSNDPNNDSVMTFDKFRQLSGVEQAKFAEEHPDEFANL